MKLCNLFLFVVLYTLATVSLVDATTGAEVVAYLKVLDSGDSSEIITAAKRISSCGYVDSAVYNRISQILKDNYASPENDSLTIDEMSWMCKALSSSGMQKYKSLVSEIARNSSNGKLRRYAQRSLAMFEEYTARNKILSGTEAYNSNLSQQENRLINMLRSGKVLLVRDAAKTIFRSSNVDEKVYDVVAEKLAKMYVSPLQHNASLDTMAWLCKALGHSGNQKYRPVLERISSENGTTDVRLLSYAKLELKKLTYSGALALTPDKNTMAVGQQKVNTINGNSDKTKLLDFYGHYRLSYNYYILHPSHDKKKVWDHYVDFGINMHICESLTLTTSWFSSDSYMSSNNTVFGEAALTLKNFRYSPFWFSVGRLSMDTYPADIVRQHRLYPIIVSRNFACDTLDGALIGAKFNNPFKCMGDGQLKVSYGYYAEDNNVMSFDDDDTSFGNISWDVINKDDHYLNIQLSRTANIYNVYNDVTNPLEFAMNSGNGYLDRQDLGDIYHTSFVYTDKLKQLSYFISGAWSQTHPDGCDEMGSTLLGSWWEDPGKKNGYMLFAGLRYDFNKIGFNIGAEINYGTEYWISKFNNRDMSSEKLITRGTVGDVYVMYELPSKIIENRLNVFIRIGCRHFEYDYTGSGNWLGAPVDIDELDDPLNAQFWAPIKRKTQLYFTLDVVL